MWSGYLGSSGMGEDHPIPWCHSYDGVRAWYTGMGRKSENFFEPLLLSHILGGIQMAPQRQHSRATDRRRPAAHLLTD